MKRLITGLALIAALSGCKTEAEKNLEKFIESAPRMQKEYGCIGEGCFSNQSFESNPRVNLYVQDKASADFLEKCMKQPLTKEQKNTLGLAGYIAQGKGVKTIIFDSSALGFVSAITYNPSAKK